MAKCKACGGSGKTPINDDKKPKPTVADRPRSSQDLSSSRKDRERTKAEIKPKKDADWSGFIKKKVERKVTKNGN